MKSYHLTDIIILVCCSLSLFTHCAWLLIIGSLVRVRLGEPALAGSKLYLGVFQFWHGVHIGVYQAQSITPFQKFER